ncbi:MAG: choice-of-anchor D domain-containing protein [Fibromonadaceae bacterium]|jgi:hypothetical protein|nr:choice-of-anchor D domain-containing protein [Fibromonadaceae bacterium]
MIRTFRNLKVWAAVLFVAVASWAQTAQILDMDDLKSQIDAFNAGSTDMTITIGADFDITSLLEIDNHGYTLTMQSLTSPPRKLTRLVTGHLFTIKKGSLTLQNIIIDGNNANSPYSANAHGSLIFIGDGGTLNMHDGTTLQNNTIQNANGSGVYVDSRGTFNMTGGTIKGNRTSLSGGGVYIYARRAVFNMSGGIITGNFCGTSATSYSGGVHFANTAFATDTDPNTTPSVFRLGGTAVIKDNTKANGSSSNVYMAGSRYITLGDGTDGVPPPTDGMEVWITKVAESGLFVNKGARAPNPPEDLLGDTKYFQADAGSQIRYIPVGKLAMVPGHDISLSPTYIKFMEISGYNTQPEHEITVKNIGSDEVKPIVELIFSLSGEHASSFEINPPSISGIDMKKNNEETFTIKPKPGLGAGTYRAFVLVSASESIDGEPIIMRRLDVEFIVGEFIEGRTLYFNQSDGKFYASSEYTEIGSLPDPDIFDPDNVTDIPASWNPETNTLKIYGANWTTTAPYALYFSQPTPVTLELVGDNFFVSNSTDNSKDHSAGIVSRSSLTINGEGSLEAKGGETGTESYGIFSLALTVNSGTIIASGETEAMKVEKDIILRVPTSKWWHPDEETEGQGEFAYTSYTWIKLQVPPPAFALEASVDISEPIVGEDTIEITLTVKDITSGEVHNYNGQRNVVLSGVQPSNFIGSLSNVQFSNGIGKINLNPQITGKQILWFSMEEPNFPAINPIVVTPIDATAEPPSILLHPDDLLTFPNAAYGYSAQTPLNFIIENTGVQPTGELTIELDGKNPTAFTISSDKVTTIAVDGSATLQVAPVLGLNAGTYTATITVDGNGIKNEEQLVVNFTVEKISGANVSTPTLASKTESSIFINAIPKPSTGQEVEYAISETKSPTPGTLEFVTFSTILSILEFPDLTTNTTYYIFARAKENTNYETGSISGPLEVYISLPSISILPVGPLTFPDAAYGYSAQTPLNFTVENTGEQPTGELTIQLSGENLTAFTISSGKVTTIAVDGETTLQVAPVLGLNAGTYTAIITVSGNNIEEEKQLVVNFTVEKASGADVPTPTLASKTESSILINAIPKPSTEQEVEYAISETSSPAPGTLDFVITSFSILEFSDLTPNTTYYIFARAKENSNYEAGKISEPLEVYISKLPDVCIPFNEIAVSLWGNNTLTVINNPANNSLNSRFSEFTWFRGGQKIGNGQSWSEYEDGRPLQPGKYHVEITDDEGKFTSCEYEVPKPNVAAKTFIDFSDIETVDVYCLSGKHLAHLNVQGDFLTEIRKIKNAYALVLKNKTGTKKTIRAMEVLK